MEQVKENSKLVPRPPVVVILGHVDHGKTTLLDYIKKTNLADREAGGITQAVSAYEIKHNDKKITFIDTPGHSAFTSIRSRGAKLADLAILVVAADDGVKPQTEESIKILKESQTPYIVAINKIDRNNGETERAKNDLLKNGVQLEGMGGDISFQEISAKTGQGVDDLLDLILLASDMEELKYDPNVPATGIILEASLNKQRGNEVVLIIKDGALKIGQTICTPTASGKVKMLEDFSGQRAKELTPSAPAIIIGFEELPTVGETFTTDPDIDANNSEADFSNSTYTLNEVESADHDLNLILKTDTAGSSEALLFSLKSLPAITDNSIAVRIISSGLGEITDGDVKQAITTSGHILGFNVKSSKAAESLAQANHITITTSKIIYELLQSLEAIIAKLLTPDKAVNSLDVLAVFSRAGTKQTIGGSVSEGVIKKGNIFTIEREGTTIGKGKITNLQCNKADAPQVEAGKECGLIVNFSAGVDIEVGDKLLIIS